MENGQIMQVDTPQVLYDFPEHRFVAEFIGDPAMNMIDVSLEASSAVHEAFRLPLPTVDKESDEWVEKNHVAVLGIRPEDLYLAREQPDLGQTTFTATVQVTEPLGDSLLLHCSVGESSFKMEAEPRAAIEPTDEIEVTYDPARVHLFDPQTGECRYHSERSISPSERIEHAPET
jgi:multiple sugar transport system ATP-binding protein